MEKSVQDNLRELGDRVAPALKNATSNTTKNLKGMASKVQTFVQENPGKSLIGAAAAGFVTALIARKLS